jgi:hypothetical protein
MKILKTESFTGQKDLVNFVAKHGISREDIMSIVGVHYHIVIFYYEEE